MKKYLYLLLIFAVTIVACTQERLVEDTVGSEKGDPCETVDLIADNANNVLDYIGATHNEALDYAAAQVDVLTANDTELFNAIKAYFLQSNQTPSFLQSLSVQSANDVSLSTQDIASGMTPENYIAAYQYPNTAMRDRILRDIHEIIFVDQDDDAQLVIDKIRKYENTFIGQQSAQDAFRYLGTFATLRYSIKYWTEASENSCHPWYKVLNQGHGTSRWPGELWMRLAIDALHHDDCLSNGGLNAGSLQQAHDNCRPGSIYSSARAFEPGLGG